MPDKERTKELLRTLQTLFEEKRSFALGINTREDHSLLVDRRDVILYSKTLDAIIDQMREIKLKFPARVSKCGLFASVDDQKWCERFKENFFKIFVDRRDCEDDEGYYQFNRQNLKGNVSGADLLYGEGFALAYLVMLEEVSGYFEDEKSGDPDFSQVLSLLQKFNKIAVGRPNSKVEEIISDRSLKCGSYSTYRSACSIKDTQDKHGQIGIFYDHEQSFIQTFFSPSFKHVECAEDFYKQYQDEIRAGNDISSAICKLVDRLGSNVHLFADANGRAGLLLGWFLAIINNETFPITLYPYFTNEEMFDEGKKWTGEFLADPKFSTRPKDGKENAMQTAQRHLAKQFAAENPEVCFISRILKNYRLTSREEVLFSVPINYEALWTIKEEGNLLEVSCGDDLLKHTKGKLLDEISVKFFLKVYEANREELAQESEQRIRDAKTAIFFLRAVCENHSEDFNEGDANLCHAIIAQYLNSSVIQEMNHDEEFQKMTKEYLKNYPNNRQKLFAHLTAPQKEIIITSIIGKESCETLATSMSELLGSNISCCGLFGSKGVDMSLVNEREGLVTFSYDVGSRWVDKSLRQLQEILYDLPPSENFKCTLTRNSKRLDLCFTALEEQELDYKSIKDYIDHFSHAIVHGLEKESPSPHNRSLRAHKVISGNHNIEETSI
jgi:hypothetical protein